MKKREIYAVPHKVLSIAEMEEQAYQKGIMAAAEFVNEYNHSSSHPYMLGDCVLGKFNLLGRTKLRKNVRAKLSYCDCPFCKA